VSHSVLRWTDIPSGARLWAVGTDIRSRRTSGWQPQFRVDVLQRTAGTVNWSPGGVGVRVDAGARLPLRAGRHPPELDSESATRPRISHRRARTSDPTRWGLPCRD